MPRGQTHKAFHHLTVFLWVCAGAFLCPSEVDAKVDVKFSGDVTQKFDDNITFAESNEQSDFITELTPGVRLNYEGKKTAVEAGVNVTQQLFWRHSENHNTAEQASVKVRHALTKQDAIFFSETFSHTYEPSSFEEEFERTGGRFSYYRNKADLAYLRDFTEQFSARLGYGNELDITTGEDLIDSYLNRAFLEGNYAFSSKDKISATYEYLNRRLKPGGSANIHTLSGGLEHFFTGQLSLEGRAGLDIIDSFNDRLLVRPLGFVKLKNQITEKTAVDLAFTQRHSTNPFTSDVLNSWRLSAGMISQIFKRLSGSANLFYGRGEYDASGIEEDLLGADMALTYELYKNLNLRLSYGISRTGSNVNSREYLKNVVSLGLNSEF